MRAVYLVEIVFYIPQHIRRFHYRGWYDLNIFFGSNGYIYQCGIRKMTKGIVGVTNACFITYIKIGSHAGVLHIQHLLHVLHLVKVVYALTINIEVHIHEIKGLEYVAYATSSIQ